MTHVRQGFSFGERWRGPVGMHWRYAMRMPLFAAWVFYMQYWLVLHALELPVISVESLRLLCWFWSGTDLICAGLLVVDLLDFREERMSIDRAEARGNAKSMQRRRWETAGPASPRSGAPFGVDVPLFEPLMDDND